MESGIISQQNTVYVLNTSYKYGNADMMNIFLTPAAIKAENIKYTTPSAEATMQTKIPQAVVEHNKETFNDKTRKSLLKLNLFIKRLKWFNIFTDTASSTAISKAQKPFETNQKCNKFLNTKKSLSTKEMYREAAKLLGIDCSLSSSCRCYDCQSHYFDYEDSTEQMDESDSECDDSGSDSDSFSSDINEQSEHYITNCYLIHTEELCECCQQQRDQPEPKQDCPPTSSFADIACNDLSFNNFLS